MPVNVITTGNLELTLPCVHLVHVIHTYVQVSKMQKIMPILIMIYDYDVK